MNILVNIPDDAADESIKKLIDRRIKDILANDTYIQERIDALLEAHINKRAQQYLDRYLDKGDLVSAIVKRLKDDAGITDQYIGRIAYREIHDQIATILKPNIQDSNEKTIQDLIKDEINNQESQD